MLLGWRVEAEAVGCVGVERHGDDELELRTFAVAESHQRLGVGQAMIESLASVVTAARLTVETDEDGVDFYGRCGFAMSSVGEVAGSERFRGIRSLGIEPAPAAAVHAVRRSGSRSRSASTSWLSAAHSRSRACERHSTTLVPAGEVGERVPHEPLQPQVTAAAERVERGGEADRA